MDLQTPWLVIHLRFKLFCATCKTQSQKGFPSSSLITNNTGKEFWRLTLVRQSWVLSTSVFLRRSQLPVKGVFESKTANCRIEDYGNVLFVQTLSQCPGRFLGMIGQNLSVSKANQLHVGIFRFFFTNVRCIPWIPSKCSVIMLKSWTSTAYFSNSTGSFVTSGRCSPFIALAPQSAYNYESPICVMQQ